MYFVYQLEPIRPEFVTDPTPSERAISGRHSDYLRELHQRGELVFAGRAMEAGGLGWVVVDVADEQRATEIMKADPQYAEGAMKGRVVQVGLARF
jgi:uncharacterized protein